ncbi:MAG: phosphatidate cytidylyltransferase [Pseudomonadota bacterium]
MLLARVISAVVAVVAILTVLFVLPHEYVTPVIAAIVLAASWEWSSLARITKVPMRIAFAVIVTALCVAVNAFLTESLFWAVLASFAIWWFAAFVMVLRYPFVMPRWGVIVAAPLTLVPMYVALLSIARFPMHELYLGSGLLLFVLVVIWGADVGGYFAGRAMGKRKLAPHVSPNKTWAGVIGGLLASALVGVVGAMIFGIPVARLVPLCIATGAISVLGDLMISLFKREAGLKDSGVLFPGHGGLLDRLDSIGAGVPLFVAGLAIGHGAW